MTLPDLFLEPELMLRLEQTTIAAKKRIRGSMQGKRRSKQLGSSLEFADYRLYTPGDDIRRFDWNVYARTGKPFIKQFMDEQELQVHLYVDSSKSMDYGIAAANKFTYARRLAACIGYIALSGFDQVSARFFGGQTDHHMPLMQGKGSVHRLFPFLADAQIEPMGDYTPSSTSSFLSSMGNPSALPRQAGMSWILSDFLAESGVEEALMRLSAAGQEIVVVQLLSPEELNPALSGDLRLIDSESGEGKEVALSGHVLRTYRETVRLYTHGLQKYCHERNLGYMLVSTSTPLIETVTRSFHEIGWLR